MSLMACGLVSSWCVLKHEYPDLGNFFLEHPACFHCRKHPSLTFVNICSYCTRMHQRADTIYFVSYLQNESFIPDDFIFTCATFKHNLIEAQENII